MDRRCAGSRDPAQAGVDGLDGRIVASQTPVWPTMSGFAKLATMKSYRAGRSPRRRRRSRPPRSSRAGGRRSRPSGSGRARVLARERRLAAAVEEVRDVGVLLGLGDVELAPAGVAKRLASERHASGGKATSTGSPASYSVIVTTSRSRGRGRRRARAVEAVERRSARAWVSWRAPVGAEVGVDDRLAVASRPSTPSMTVGATNSSFSPRAYAARSPRALARAPPPRGRWRRSRARSAPSAGRDPSRSSGRRPSRSGHRVCAGEALLEVAHERERRARRRVPAVEQRVDAERGHASP
jgi:hypothetical protein